MEWKSSNRSTVAVIRGPRGIGKTTITENLGSTYSRFIRLDLGTDPRLGRLIADRPDADRLVHRLRSSYGEDSIVDGDTLLIIDEVQCCPGVYHALGNLTDRDDLHTIATCSYSSEDDVPSDRPMSWEERFEMRPLDFDEFTGAMSVDDEVNMRVRERLERNQEPRPDDGRLMLRLFSDYMVTGGYPEAVDTLAETNDYRAVMGVNRRNRVAQMSDVFRFRRRSFDVISACMDSIPEQLVDNGKFSYSKVEGRVNHNSRYYRDSIDWLESSGMVSRCNRLNHPLSPPNLSFEEGSFKLYTDPGALLSLMPPWAADHVICGNHDECGCAVVENCIGSLLSLQGIGLNYYSNGRRELDFVIPRGREFIGVGVKSGNNSRRKSLDSLIEEGMIQRGIIFGDYRRRTSAEVYPYYAVGFADTLLCPERGGSIQL